MTDKVAKQNASNKDAFQRARHGSEKEWKTVGESDEDIDLFGSPGASRRIKKENDEKALTIVGLRLEDAEVIYPEEVREVIKDGVALDELEEDLNGSRANVETFGGEIIRIVYWG